MPISLASYSMYVVAANATDCDFLFLENRKCNLLAIQENHKCKPAFLSPKPIQEAYITSPVLAFAVANK